MKFKEIIPGDLIVKHDLYSLSGYVVISIKETRDKELYELVFLTNKGLMERFLLWDYWDINVLRK